MHQLSVDVHNQVAVSLVEFLKHLATSHNVRDGHKGKFCFENVCLSCSLREILSAADIHRAPHKIEGIARRSPAIAPVLHSSLDDKVETRSFLPPRRTSVWPKYHPSPVDLAAMKASIY